MAKVGKYRVFTAFAKVFMLSCFISNIIGRFATR